MPDPVDQVETINPRTPEFNVGEVFTLRFDQNSADKSLHDRYHRRANIEIGGAGVDT